MTRTAAGRVLPARVAGSPGGDANLGPFAEASSPDPGAEGALRPVSTPTGAAELPD